MYRNYPENLGGLGKIWGLCPFGPNLEPPLLKNQLTKTYLVIAILVTFVCLGRNEISSE